MKIKHLSITNYKSLRNIQLDNLDSKNIITISGENGTGKSSIFDAINYLILKSTGQRNDEVKDIVTKGEEAFSIELEFVLNDAEVQQYNKPSDKFKVTLKGELSNNSQTLGGETGWLNEIVEKKAQERGEFTYEKVDGKYVLVDPLKTYKLKKSIYKIATAGNLIYIPPHRHEQPADLLKSVDDGAFNSLYDTNQRFKKSAEQLSRSGFVMNYILDLYFKSEKAKKDEDVSSDKKYINEYENFFKEFNTIFRGSKKFKEVRYDEDVKAFKFIIQDLIFDNEIEFKDLSSGEKEVIFMLTYLRTQNPNGCIVCIDEPELHIHHRLQSKLLDQLLKIGRSNQIILMTHSLEIVRKTKKLNQGVYEIRRYNKVKKESQLRECTTDVQWKSLFKQITNGLEDVLLTDIVVYVEGIGKEEETLKNDAELYQNIFSNEKLHFISAGSRTGVLKATIETIKAMQEGIGFKKVYGIRDGDGLSVGRKAAIVKNYEDRLWILARYSLENYFLDYDILGKYLGLPAEEYLDKLKKFCMVNLAKLAKKIQDSRKAEEKNHTSIKIMSIRKEIKDGLSRSDFNSIPGKSIIGEFLKLHGTATNKNYGPAVKKALCLLLNKALPSEFQQIQKKLLN